MTAVRRLRVWRDHRAAARQRAARYQWVIGGHSRVFGTLTKQRQNAASADRQIKGATCLRHPKAKRRPAAPTATPAQCPRNLTYYQLVVTSSHCHIAALEDSYVVNVLMLLSAFIAYSTFHRGPCRSDNGDAEWIVFAACVGDPFDVMPRTPPARARSAIQVEARGG
jgi:hypothetical protein